MLCFALCFGFGFALLCCSALRACTSLVLVPFCWTSTSRRYGRSALWYCSHTITLVSTTRSGRASTAPPTTTTTTTAATSGGTHSAHHPHVPTHPRTLLRDSGPTLGAVTRQYSNTTTFARRDGTAGSRPFTNLLPRPPGSLACLTASLP